MSFRFLILPLLFVLMTSFWWSEDEEKQLRDLHQNAKLALKENRFEDAKEMYEKLLKKIDPRSPNKYQIDWHTYIDATMCLAEVFEELGESEEGEKVINALLERSPPHDFLPKIELFFARFRAEGGASYAQMKKIAVNLPVEKWRSEERSFLKGLELGMNSHYEALNQKAKRFFVSGYYQKAAALYEEVAKGIELEHYPNGSPLLLKKMHYRLAECHYYQANYDKTLSLLKEGDEKIDREMLYLAALCYREKHAYEKALNCFEKYTSSADRADLDHYDHALFEIGLFYYKARNFARARRYFEILSHLEQKKGKPAIVGALYLARLNLKDRKPREVERRLAPLSRGLALDDPLKYEAFYLRGMAAYQSQEYAGAVDFFERSLPSRRDLGSWTSQAYFHLGQSFVKLGDDSLKGKQVRLGFFDKAGVIFKKLLLTSEFEPAALALGRLYLLRNEHSHVDPLLTPLYTSLSHEGQLEALLLRAQAAPTYETREFLYAQATANTFQKENGYAQGWYYRGLNHFEKALQNSERTFDDATVAFEHAFRLFEKRDRQHAAHILKLEAKANFYRNSPISSLALLEKLLTEFSETFEEREETLYLRGLVASRLTDLSYFPVAEESLNQVVASYPKGEYADDALHVLGTLYYNQENYALAKEKFLQLAEDYPTSPYAGEGWFWAAEAGEQLGENVQQLRQMAYEKYPNSEHAAEAYFRQFSYTDYVKGGADAIAHLEAFTLDFPCSPLVIVTDYLLGRNQSDPEAAKEIYTRALAAFRLCSEREKVPDISYLYFRYQTMYELASLHIDQDAFDAGIELLQTIIQDFGEEAHPLKQKTSYPLIFEESEFALAKAYLKQGKAYLAQEVFSSMLAHYEKAGIQEGAYLSHVWREQGKLAIACEDYDTALCCLEMAEECGKGHLNHDERLSLWILQSDGFRLRGEFDIAMRMLSKVINADVASPLRLDAMYLRAEIYELQGRPELAMRQLEAAAKKGEPRSQQKLRIEYALD